MICNKISRKKGIKGEKLFLKRKITWKYERKESYISCNWNENEMDIVVFKNIYLLKVIQLFMRKGKIREDREEKLKERRFS